MKRWLDDVDDNDNGGGKPEMQVMKTSCWLAWIIEIKLGKLQNHNPIVYRVWAPLVLVFHFRPSFYSNVIQCYIDIVSSESIPHV